MRVQLLELKAIRGFRDQFQLALGKHLTVLYGANGSGKSSLCEAWDWLYTGKDMGEALEPKNETKRGFQNLHTSDKPWCKITLADSSNDYFVQRTSPNASPSHNLPDKISLTSPVVLQYRLQKAVYVADVDRTFFFASVLGAEDAHALLKSFKGAVVMVDGEIKNAKKPWDTVVTDAQTIGLTFTTPNPTSADDLETAEAELVDFLASLYECEKTEADCIAAVKKLGGMPKSKDITVTNLVPKGLLNADAASHLKLGLEALSNIKGLDKAGRNYADWLTVGLALAKPPACPFCTSDTLTEGFKDAISTRITENSKSAADWKTADLALGRASKIVESGNQEVVKALVANLDAVAAAAAELKGDAKTKVTAHVNAAKEAVQAWQLVLKETESNDAAARFIGATHLIQALRDFEAATPSLQSLLNGRLAPFNQAKFAINSLQYLEGKERKTWKNAMADKVLADRLFELGQREYEALLAQTVTEVESEIKKWYGFLRPKETSTLQGIAVEHGASMKIRFKAETHGVSGPASALFSQSNVNALGMACYIARIKKAGHKTIVLDDPTQSLDPQNKKQFETEFVDMLLKEGFQVVICTHDINTARNLLDEHLDYDPVGHAFTGHGKDGPIHTPLHGDVDHLIRKALEAIESKDESRRENAALAVRKLTEKAVGEFLVYRKVSFKANQPLKGLVEELDKLPQPIGPKPEAMKALVKIREGISHPLHTATESEAPTLKEIGGFLKELVRLRQSPGYLNIPDKNWPQSSSLKSRIEASEN